MSTDSLQQFVSSKVGVDEYLNIWKMANDSIKNWKRNNLRGWKGDATMGEAKLDTIICINSKNDKVIMANLGRVLRSNSKLDAIGYFYGVKIKGGWYFFGGPTMYIPRDTENLNKPTSFTKLHEIAMDNIFKGYLKKNKQSGEWEINEGFFARFYERDAYNFRFTTQEAWEESWLKLMRENWGKRDTTDYKTLQ